MSVLSPANPKKTPDENTSELMSLFWKKGLFKSFSGIADINIHYAHFKQEQDSLPTIVVVPGRCESYLKYQELAFDLYHQGYNVFIIDHRGQGLSDRLLSNKNKGYVVNFQDYVDDFSYFIKKIVSDNNQIKPFILAHSMGGAIATRFMQDSPGAIKAAIISSPMLGFNSGKVPAAIASALITFKLLLNKLFRQTPWYFFGQSDYAQVPFSENRLTHSKERYQDFIDLYQREKAIQLGGVTSHWLSESIDAQKEIFARIGQLKTPILLLQAGSDTVVCQQAQDDFCQQLHQHQPQSCPDGVPVRFNNAYHEIFFEIDDYRAIALQQSVAWFKQHN